MVTALTNSAALTRIADLQTGLQREIGARNQDVERLVRARRLMTGLVVHDLQSPLHGIRNALRAAASLRRAAST